MKAAVLALGLPALTLACGGGASSTSASKMSSGLVYTAPADTSGWWLKKDSASTSTRLVLDLMAPSGVSGQGVTLVLASNAAQAAWHAFGTGVYLQGLAYPSPQVDVTSLQGSTLRVVAGQSTGAVAYGSAPVLQVALDLVSGTLTGASIPLTVATAGHLSSGSVEPITVQTGTLAAQ